MAQLSFLIKPASALCNQRCRYCFYEDEAAHRAVKNRGMMSEETAGRLIRAACAEAGRGGELLFAFQGGEPTLAGLPFFRRFVELVNGSAAPGTRVSYSIQTNGSLLDAEWAAFLAENRFLVGLSLDGSREMHDLNRVDAEGKGTWGRTVKALRLLQKSGVEVNLLCVVTGQLARRPQQMYNSLKRLGVRYLQFIPCLDPIGNARGSAAYSLRAEEYGAFLCRLFDLWYEDWKRGEYVSVRLFDDYVHILCGEPVSACSASGRCGSYLVAESDGSLYPCDFYALDEWRLGDLRDGRSLKAIAECETARRFLAGSEERPNACRACRWFFLCRGGCRRDWCERDGETVNGFCESFRRFFPHSIDRLREIAAAEIAFTRGLPRQ